MRNLFRRHPDLFLKSFASMKGKITYLSHTLNRQLHSEKAFPLLLHYNYSKHIWPRCEVLRDNGIKNYDLIDALCSTDQEFCEKFEIAPSDYKEKQGKKPYIEEKDKLWVYSKGGM